MKRGVILSTALLSLVKNETRGHLVHCFADLSSALHGLTCGTSCVVLQVGMAHNTTRNMLDNDETAIRGCRAAFVELTGGPGIDDDARQLNYKGSKMAM